MKSSCGLAVACACLSFLAGACGGRTSVNLALAIDATGPPPRDAGSVRDATTSMDAAAPDTGRPDAGSDATLPETGPDAGSDATLPETGPADASSGDTSTGDTYSIGGTVSGLSGSGLVLSDNSGDDLAVSADGSFVFAAQLGSGQTYAVTVAAAPSGETCYIPNPSGTVGHAAVTNIVVTCRSGLVAYYPFDEGGGTTMRDVTGNGNDGTHDAAYVQGVIGTALAFDGTQSATVNGNASFTWGGDNGDYTVDYWLMTLSMHSNWVHIFHKSDTTGGNCCDDYERSPAQWFAPATLQVIAVMATTEDGNPYTQTSDFVIGQWTHFATVHSGAAQTQTLYVNGVLAAVPNPPYTASNPNPEALGAPSVGGPGILTLAKAEAMYQYDGLTGQMDELRIYNVALTQAQIQLDMQ
jgi:hypothetical protein